MQAEFRDNMRLVAQATGLASFSQFLGGTISLASACIAKRPFCIVVPTPTPTRTSRGGSFRVSTGQGFRDNMRLVAQATGLASFSQFLGGTISLAIGQAARNSACIAKRPFCIVVPTPTPTRTSRGGSFRVSTQPIPRRHHLARYRTSCAIDAVDQEFWLVRPGRPGGLSDKAHVVAEFGLHSEETVLHSCADANSDEN
jgi:phage gpG-like protein